MQAEPWNRLCRATGGRPRRGAVSHTKWASVGAIILGFARNIHRLLPGSKEYNYGNSQTQEKEPAPRVGP